MLLKLTVKALLGATATIATAPAPGTPVGLQLVLVAHPPPLAPIQLLAWTMALGSVAVIRPATVAAARIVVARAVILRFCRMVALAMKWMCGRYGRSPRPPMRKRDVTRARNSDWGIAGDSGTAATPGLRYSEDPDRLRD